MDGEQNWLTGLWLGVWYLGVTIKSMNSSPNIVSAALEYTSQSHSVEGTQFLIRNVQHLTGLGPVTRETV